MKYFLRDPFDCFFSKPDKLAEGFCIPPFLSKCGPFDLQQTARFTNAFHQRRLGFVKKKKYCWHLQREHREKRGKRWELKDFCTFSLLHIYFCEFLSWGREYLHDDLFTFGKCTANCDSIYYKKVLFFVLDIEMNSLHLCCLVILALRC